MLDVEVLLSLAEIAGVFVGFGALIAVRSGGPSQPQEVAPMRAMVSLGLLTVMAALAPVTLGRYDLNGHEIWALSSALVLAGLFVLVAANARTPEYRANWATELDRGGKRGRTAALIQVAQGVVWVIYMGALAVAPVPIMLGLLTEIEAALYFTVVVLLLLGAGWTLLGLVFTGRHPSTE
jgi:hypothetical protein